MTPQYRTRADWINRVAEEYGRGRPLALLFDCDGTLVPIVEHPRLARLPAQTRQCLQRLAAFPDVRVGVISGRALDDVRELVGLAGAYYAGSGGLEVDFLGARQRYPEMDAIEVVLEQLQVQWQDQVGQFPGAWLERKPGAIALHFRGLLPAAADSFHQWVTRILSIFGDLSFRVVSEAVEVTPSAGWNKGTTVASILAHMERDLGRPPLAVYCGDAANDAEGMAMATQLDGMSVGIGPHAPEGAVASLASPAELAESLGELAIQLAFRRNLSIPDSTQ